LLISLGVFAVLGFAQAPPYADLHDFGGKVMNTTGKLGPDGANPSAGVTFDSNGNMFGTTSNGGAYGFGIIWEITALGVYKDLHDFGGKITNANGKPGPDGQNPNALISVDLQNNLYGSTFYGGPNVVSDGGAGMLWKLSPVGVYKDLHDFGGTVINANGKKGPDGAHPASAEDAGSYILGTATSGGPYSGGVIWQINDLGTYQDVHDFGGFWTDSQGMQHPDGIYADSNIVFDIAGNAYGTTEYGGSNEAGTGGAGILWEITNMGVYLDLHDFGAPLKLANGLVASEGKWPSGQISIFFFVIYGTCSAGGPNAIAGDYGNGSYWVLGADSYYFGGTTVNATGKKGPDGSYPNGATLFRGSIFGNTTYGGAYDSKNGGAGMVFDMGGTNEDLHDFGGTVVNANGKSGPDGFGPAGAVRADNSGNLYGTTEMGGPNNAMYGGSGIVWRIITSEKSFAILPTSVVGGNSSIGAVTLAAPAPSDGTPISLSSNSPSAQVPATVTVAKGNDNVSFSITTTPVKVQTVATITATQGSVVKTATLTIKPPTVDGLALSPNPLTGGDPCTATVHLDGLAPTGGKIVTITTNSVNLKVPSSVTVPAGSFSTTFPVISTPQSTNTPATITATTGTVSQTANVTILAPAVSGLSLSPSSVQGSSSTVVTGKVTINGPAPSAGSIVTLTSSNLKVLSIPAGVKVVGGTTTVTFPTRHFAVTTAQYVTVTATLGQSTVKVQIEVTP
jgi:uncharacterized repeat protein (TIGR03803 family)